MVHINQSTDPAFTAKEIAKEFDKTRQWAHGKPQELEHDGYLQSKNPGGNARFYWITKTGVEYLASTR